MKIFPTETKLCCKTLGSAMTRNCRKSAPENGRTGSSVRIRTKRTNTTATAATQLTPWQRNVAHATPATPSGSAVTNTISSPILAVELMARKMNGVRLSPSAVKMPVERL